MTISEQKNRIGALLGEKPVETVKRIRKNDGLLEKRYTACAKTLITEDNKLLLND